MSPAYSLIIVSVRQEEVVALGPWPNCQLGLAIDLGTTKVAGYLVDLSGGWALAAKGMMNPVPRKSSEGATVLTTPADAASVT